MNEAISNNSISNDEVNAALQGILTTDKFAASPQMSAFLKYVVEQTLLGHTRRIKAFTVGIEALGKSTHFDPQTDPSVRVLAKRLRTSLDAYYEQNKYTEVFIEMKPGSYIPKFLRRSEMPQQVYKSSDNSLTEDESNAVQAAATGTSSGAHVNVQSEPAPQEADNQGMNKLWQNYRSSSKVA